MRNGLSTVVAGPAIETASSAGKRAQAGSQGMTPKQAPSGAAFDVRDAGVEQGRVAAELVDREAADHRGICRIEHRLRADEARDHAAALDVAEQQHRYAGASGEAHVRDVSPAQVRFGRAARALDQYEFVAGAQAGRSSA